MIRSYIGSRDYGFRRVMIATLVGYLVTQGSIQEGQSQSRQTEDTRASARRLRGVRPGQMLVKPKDGVSTQPSRR
jgi:hypothetical protein